MRLSPLGPHLLTARDGSQALCGGPRVCPACEYDATLATLRVDNKALLEALLKIEQETIDHVAVRIARAAIAHSERQMNQERKS